jgi:plasmid maintenance system antidote protein VapI
MPESGSGALGNSVNQGERSIDRITYLGMYPSFWYDMQSSYELAQAKRKKIPRIAPLNKAA